MTYTAINEYVMRHPQRVDIPSYEEANVILAAIALGSDQALISALNIQKFSPKPKNEYEQITMGMIKHAIEKGKEIFK